MDIYAPAIVLLIISLLLPSWILNRKLHQKGLQEARLYALVMSCVITAIIAIISFSGFLAYESLAYFISTFAFVGLIGYQIYVIDRHQKEKNV